jgi:methylated-DNA-[protein]-cysteine S-methyltransferase
VRPPARVQRPTLVRHGWAETRLGRLLVATTPRGVCAIELGSIGDDTESLARLRAFMLRRMSCPEWVADQGAVGEAALQLEEYARGERRRFELPLDLFGTDFERQVWRELRSIPFGATRTYGEVARALGAPGASRAVGRASGMNPLPLVVPCHRVLAAGGKLGGFSAGLGMKRRLLALEGVLLVG